MSAASRSAAAACALVVAVAVAVETTTDNDLLSEACYLAVLVGASVAAWIGVARRSQGRRLIPCLIAAGVSLNALGEVVWEILDLTGSNPDVSIADLAWFSSYVFLGAALWVVLSRTQKDGRVDLGFVVDAVTIVVISVLVFWRFTVGAIVADSTVSPFVRAVWASYPVLDAILLALVLRVLLSRSARASIDGWFAVGGSLWLAADILYIKAPDNPTAVMIMDAAWMVGPVLLARATWRDRDSASDAASGSAAPGGWVTQLAIAVFPLIVPPGLELIADVRGQADEPWQLFIGMTVVIGLALVRTGRLIRSEQQAQRELEVARDAALAASDAKSIFLANISHEIRTPLTTVLGSGELLKETPLDDRQAKLVGMMRRSGQQLLSLVEGLLDFSRIEAGKVELDRAEFNLHALVTDIVDAHLPRAARRGISFDWEIDPRVPRTVVGDRTKVFQVLNNLVENALKFIEEGRVHLSVCPVEGDIDGDGDVPSGGVQFSVADTGIGIREEHQASVFDSFNQVDGTASRRYQGTGLGLAICKQVTELMGGTITVQSKFGVGSTFTVRLPLTASGSAHDADRADADAIDWLRTLGDSGGQPRQLSDVE